MSGLLLPLSHCLSVAGRVGPHVATRCRTPHSVVAVAVLEANIVFEHVFVPRGSVKPAVLCGISSRLIGEQTKPVVGRFPCNTPVATSASLPLLPLCQPLPLQRPGESIERKELGVPLRDIRLRIMCQRERICGVAATLLVAALQLILGPRRHVPRRPAMVRRATEPLTANILAAGAGQGTGRQSCYSRLVAPAGGGTGRSGSGALKLLWSLFSWLLGEQSFLRRESVVWSRIKPRNSVCNELRH